MNETRSDHGSAALGDKVYVFGGKRGLRTLATIEILTVATEAWQIMTSDAFIARSHTSICVVGPDQILICGGLDRKHFRSELLLFSASTNTVEKIGDAPFKFDCKS